MDDNNRKRRQNDPAHYPTSDPRYGQDNGPARGFGEGATDRFRPPPPITPPSAGRGIGGHASAYGYYAESTSSFPSALAENAMQYQTDYGTDQRQQQSFASYNPTMMYGVNQPTTQTAVYESAQQFQPRQTAAMQILPEVPAPYYTAGPSSAPDAAAIQHQQPSSSSTAFQQSPVDRTSLLQGYAGSMTSVGSMPQGQAEGMDEEEYRPNSLDEAYHSYQNALKGVFQSIRDGMLIEASSSLLEVSNWLLSHVGELGEPPFIAPTSGETLTVFIKGLTADAEALYNDRIKMWNEFNTAWLAVLQKQKDLTLEMIRSGGPPRHPQSTIPFEFLKRMAKDLIRLCDTIEKHGLVDYQYGVWEERIIAVLTECVDLIEDNGEETVGGGPLTGIGGRAPP